MCGYFCIEFIYFTMEGKSLLGFTNFFTSEHEVNDKKTLKHFQYVE